MHFSFGNLEIAIYSCLAGRASLSFRGTVVAYSERTIKILYGALALHFVITVVVIAVGIDYERTGTNRKSNGGKLDDGEGGGKDGEMMVCQTKASFAAVGYVALLDVFFTALFVYMFVVRATCLLCDSLFLSHLSGLMSYMSFD